MKPVVVLQGVHKAFRRGLFGPPVSVLSDINVEVSAGELLAVTGGNGSGKSTLLRVVAGILTPEHGTVAAPGPIAWVSGNRRALYGRLTVREAFEFSGALLGLAGADLEAAAARAVETMALGQFLDHRCAQLSTGTAARAVLAMSLLGQPAVMLVDEVERSADSENRELIRSAIGEVAAAGAAILWATHDPVVVEGAHRRLDLGSVEVQPR